MACCGLLRVSEYCVSARYKPNMRKVLTVGDVTFGRDKYGDKAVLMVCPSKKGAFATGRRVPVELRDGQYLQPVSSLRRMLRRMPR